MGRITKKDLERIEKCIREGDIVFNMETRAKGIVYSTYKTFTGLYKIYVNVDGCLKSWPLKNCYHKYPLTQEEIDRRIAARTPLPSILEKDEN